MKNIKNCKVLKTIAATTFWEDDQELKILMAACNHLNIHSFRWLCYELGVINKRIHKSDNAFKKYAATDCATPLCKDLKINFGCGCKLDCGVTTPLALSCINAKDLEGVNFIQDKGWLYAIKETDSKIHTHRHQIKLCKSFYVNGAANSGDEHHDDWGYVLSFYTPSSLLAVEKRLAIKTEDILNNKLISILNKFGVQIQQSTNDQIMDLIRIYILDYKKRASPTSSPLKDTVTSIPGWKNTDLNNRHYVSPTSEWINQGNILPANNVLTPLPRIIFYYHLRNISNPFVAMGTAAEWLAQNLSSIEQQAPSAITFEKLLISGISLLPFQLKPHNLPICIFHIWGNDKNYREMLLRFASSIWGKPDAFIYKISYFEKNLNDICLLHNDSLICLSEISDLSYKQYIRLILKLSYEEIPYRTADIQTKQVILSSGENPIFLSATNQVPKPPIVINIELRSLPLQNDCWATENSYGCFSSKILEQIYQDTSSMPQPYELGFSESFKSAIGSNRRQKNKTNIKTIEKISLQTHRLSMKTLELANPPLPLPNDYAQKFRDRLLEHFNQSLANRSKQEKESVDYVKRYLEGHGHSRLISGETFCPDIKYENNLDGYFTKFKNRWYALILTERFDYYFCQTCPKKRLAELLYEDKILKPGTKNSLSRTHWIKGLKKSKRGYLLKLPTLSKSSKMKLSNPQNMALFSK